MKAKWDPRRTKIEHKNEDEKRSSSGSSWSRLGSILGRLGCRLGVKIVLSPRVALVFLKNHFFDVKTVRRRLWDQLWPTKAPKRPKMTPKTEPKSTPRRSKIDVKIVIKNDGKPRGLGTKRPGEFGSGPAPGSSRWDL